MRRSFLPLRLKFTLWSLAVFVAIHLIVSMGWITVRRQLALRALDAQLSSNAEFVIGELIKPTASLRSQDELDELTAKVSRSQLLERFFVQIRAADGAFESSSTVDKGLASVNIPPPKPGRELEFGDVEVTLGRDETSQLRVITQLFPTETGARFYLQLATPDPSAADASHTVLLALLGLPIGTLAAGIMAWIMAGRLVRPIQRMTKAARGVSPATLRARIDVGPSDSEIARLQHELNHALERLENGYRAQGTFISNVSHELKTPVAVLLSQAQVLRRGASAEDLRRFSATVEDEMRTMARLVESLLVLARVEHGKELVRREVVPLNEIVFEAAERASPMARDLDIPLVTNLHLPNDGEPEPEIHGDPDLLRTMVENLVRNAVRFSPRGEPVDLRLVCAGGEASITVRDRGPGIPPEHIERVFERFYQVPHEGHQQRGSGLGLAIAKSVAEMHQGRIVVRNRASGGCEFEIRLPLERWASGGSERARIHAVPEHGAASGADEIEPPSRAA